jgi:hypothetical protein
MPGDSEEHAIAQERDTDEEQIQNLELDEKAIEDKSSHEGFRDADRPRYSCTS